MKKNKQKTRKIILLFFLVVVLFAGVLWAKELKNREKAIESAESNQAINNEDVEFDKEIDSEEQVKPDSGMDENSEIVEEKEEEKEKEIPMAENQKIKENIQEKKPKEELPVIKKTTTHKKQVIKSPEVKKEEITDHDVSTILANSKNYVYTIYTDLEQGSGFIYNAKGDILTNAHVTKDASYVTVVNSKGQEFNGEIIGISEKTDISLIRVKELEGKTPLQFEMGKVPNNTPVIAIGSPENIRNTSSKGKILSYGKEFFDDYYYTDLYETDALIKRGSSGGPLISAKSGKVLGINSIILIDNPKIGYAIPIANVKSQVDKWAAKSASVVSDEIYDHDVENAYLDEKLLTNYVQDFYKLMTYSLNDPGVTYYETFLLPKSPAVAKGKKMASALMETSGRFMKVESEVRKVTIQDNVALVLIHARFVYENLEDSKEFTFEKENTYHIVIDEYGDYQISDIE